MSGAEGIRVEIVYATADHQIVIELRVPPGSTLADVVERSGLIQRLGDLAWPGSDLGVFGQLRSPTDRVEQGDRVEIYRPLAADPKEVRRVRVNRARRKSGS